MGRDKALLPFRGATLAHTVARAVEAAAGNVFLVGNPHRHGFIGHGLTGNGSTGNAVVPDIYPGEGPLGGILTALRHSQADWNLIVACDMPALSTDFLGQMLDAAEHTAEHTRDADALVPTGPAGRPEPLCAVYHRRARQGLYAAFARGVRRVGAALEEVRSVPWPVPQVHYFQNVNTPEDWALYGR
jgi:molybdopterin-guanine dinucleotide biosynthesis protein A